MSHLERSDLVVSNPYCPVIEMIAYELRMMRKGLNEIGGRKEAREKEP